jgi:hypothetical protein
MKCSDCERLWSAYVDTTRHNVRIAAQLRLTRSTGDKQSLVIVLENALSADFAWRVARWALEDHIATNHPDQDPIVLLRNT